MIVLKGVAALSKANCLGQLNDQTYNQTVRLNTTTVTTDDDDDSNNYYNNNNK